MTSSILVPDPWSLEAIAPQLHVYRRGRADCLVVPHTISPEGLSALLENNQLLASRLTFVVHGFRNTVEIPWMQDMKDALLRESDQTVVLLDWGNGADLMAARYLQAAANIQTVGKWLGGHISYLGEAHEALTLWGIGHSLGCHLLGIAGRDNGSLDRISAMDPAGPAFEKHAFMSHRLRPTDARLVDVIHTDGYDSFLDPEDWISPVNHYGTLIPLGTIDFYPNYGYDQPGAGPVSSHLIAASHLRAIDLFLWSISHPEEFRSTEVLDGTPAFEAPVKKTRHAQDSAEMGYHAFRACADAGNFYIQTNKAEPWVSPAKIQKMAPGHGGSFEIIEDSSPDMEAPEADKEESRGLCIIS